MLSLMQHKSCNGSIWMLSIRKNDHDRILLLVITTTFSQHDIDIWRVIWHFVNISKKKVERYNLFNILMYFAYWYYQTDVDECSMNQCWQISIYILYSINLCKLRKSLRQRFQFFDAAYDTNSRPLAIRYDV